MPNYALNKKNINIHYPLSLWDFSGIMYEKIQMEHNMVKNPNY